MKKIAIIGTGGSAREVLCLLADLGQYDKVVGFMEPDDIWEKNWHGRSIMGIPVLKQSSFDPDIYGAVIGIGNSRIRERVVQQLPPETEYMTLIHPNVVISKWVEIGEGAVICAGCILTCQIKIGKQAQLNLQTTISHDCQIGDFFTTAPGVNINGTCHFGKHVYMGASSSTRQGVSICDSVTVGMGAMVLGDIAEAGTYVGIPAKKMGIKKD